MSSCLPDLDLYPVSSLFVTGRLYGHKLLGCFNICVFYEGKKKKLFSGFCFFPPKITVSFAFGLHVLGVKEA